jgi:hypothetical protein
MAVELGSVSLDKLTGVVVRERARLAHHQVPGLAGELVQLLGRPSVQVTLDGIFFGPDSTANLAALRELYRAGDPLDFFADAVGDGYFAQVVITGLRVAQRAGETDQFGYSCDLVEFVEPPRPAGIDPLAVIDTDLAAEATAFVDEVQSAVEGVTQLSALVTGLPSFADPTTLLTALPAPLVTLTGSGALDELAAIQDRF